MSNHLLAAKSRIETAIKHEQSRQNRSEDIIEGRIAGLEMALRYIQDEIDIVVEWVHDVIGDDVDISKLSESQLIEISDAQYTGTDSCERMIDCAIDMTEAQDGS